MIRIHYRRTGGEGKPVMIKADAREDSRVSSKPHKA